MEKQVEVNKDGEVAVGTLYELNQQAYMNVEPYTFVQVTSELHDIYEWVNEKKCKYAMLLCNDRKDYTIFNYLNQKEGEYLDGTLSDLRECLENRGKILDIRYLQDMDCWEVWLRIWDGEDGEPQNYLYMFFDCEQFVIEV